MMDSDSGASASVRPLGWRRQAGVSLGALLLTATRLLGQEPGQIDFRNLIPGQLDAPVYEADGVTRLAGDRYTAQLTALCGGFPDTPPAVIGNGIAIQPFQTGALAGYWEDGTVRVHCAMPGEWIWAQVRILDRPPGVDGNPLLVRATTAPFAVELGDTPVPLPGLSSITLTPLPSIIDFRNRVPGHLDAPFYEADGVTKLQGPAYWVRLNVDLNPFDESGPTHWEPIGMSMFQSGDMAGYWEPKRWMVHGISRDGFPGDRIWARLDVLSHAGSVPRGSSDPFILDLEPVTPLLGLKPMNVNPPPPEIAFCNYVEGLLDAPVYDVDGTTRLGTYDSHRFMVQLYVDMAMSGDGPTSLAPLASPVPMPSERGPGYFDGGPVVVPWAKPGEWVWVNLRVFEFLPTSWGPESTPPAFWGASEPFKVLLTESPAIMTGMPAFRLNAQDCRIKRETDQVTITWPTIPSVTAYRIDVTTGMPPASWQTIFHGPPTSPHEMSVTMPTTDQQVYFRLVIHRSRP